MVRHTTPSEANVIADPDGIDNVAFTSSCSIASPAAGVAVIE